VNGLRCAIFSTAFRRRCRTKAKPLNPPLVLQDKVPQMQSALIREQKMKQLVSDITGQMVWFRATPGSARPQGLGFRV